MLSPFLSGLQHCFVEPSTEATRSPARFKQCDVLRIVKVMAKCRIGHFVESQATQNVLSKWSKLKTQRFHIIFFRLSVQ